MVATASSAPPPRAKTLADEFGCDRWAARSLDVTTEKDVVSALEFTVGTYGRMDGIVNNAGILIPNDVVSATEEYDRTFGVNVKGVFLGCKYTVPALLASGGGSIVNIGSINSLAAEKQLALYTASKGAADIRDRRVGAPRGQLSCLDSPQRDAEAHNPRTIASQLSGLSDPSRRRHDRSGRASRRHREGGRGNPVAPG